MLDYLIIYLMETEILKPLLSDIMNIKSSFLLFTYLLFVILKVW